MHIRSRRLCSINALLIGKTLVSHDQQQIVERRQARGLDFSLSPSVGDVLCALGRPPVFMRFPLSIFIYFRYFASIYVYFRLHYATLLRAVDHVGNGVEALRR